MNVTIKDIARELDLNFSSVSRALNNKPGVSEETRRIIRDKAEEMGYHPNVLARGLVSRTMNTIGVIMPDIVNPVFGAITTGVIETAAEHNYDVFLCITNWSEKKEEDYIYTILEKQVDGIIIKGISEKNTRLLESSNIPAVGYESWDSSRSFSSVSTDNIKAGFLAGEHLYNYGYRKTAVLPGPANSSAAAARIQGFCSAFAEHNCTIDSSRIIYCDYNIESGFSGTADVLGKFPDTDSILAGNDVIALGILHYLEKNGIRAGKEIGVVGFDNIQFAALPQIELTTVKQQKHSIGRIMTTLLFEDIAGIKEGIENYPRRIFLEPELIIRKTTIKQKKSI